MNYLQDIYRLAYIKRYSNIPKLHEESVAEHGFFVAAIVMQLHEEYRFDLGRAICIATAHDMAEMELNDAPWIIKQKYPAIKKAFEECEAEVLKQMPIAVRKAAQEFEEAEIVEAKVVILADAMQCLQFATEELKTGNEGYMREVYNNSVKRIVELQEELEEYAI